MSNDVHQKWRVHQVHAKQDIILCEGVVTDGEYALGGKEEVMSSVVMLSKSLLCYRLTLSTTLLYNTTLTTAQRGDIRHVIG